MEKIKYLAFYLPQFHETEENNKWWGKGFTEWTNVKSAVPLFEGHNQPNIPQDGYYDLTDVNVMIKQANLAKEYGLYGFCYYYYWFDGKKTLYKPLENMLKTPEVDIPFCLCWANHDWTRTWEAKSKEILLACKYPKNWFIQYIDDTIKYFNDPRYIKIDNKHLLLIYDVKNIPNISLMRKYAKEKYNIELFIVAFENNDSKINPNKYDCDASYEFTPSWSKTDAIPKEKQIKLFENHKVTNLDYRSKAIQSILRDDNKYLYFQGVNLGFDNSPRRKKRNPIIQSNFSPENFRIFLEEISKKAYNKPADKRFVFIVAWNEWGESCYLEPDTRNGYKYLEIIKNIHDLSKDELLKIDNTNELLKWSKIFYNNIYHKAENKKKPKSIFRITSKKLIKGCELGIFCKTLGEKNEDI